MAATEPTKEPEAASYDSDDDDVLRDMPHDGWRPPTYCGDEAAKPILQYMHDHGCLEKEIVAPNDSRSLADALRRSMFNYQLEALSRDVLNMPENALRNGHVGAWMQVLNALMVTGDHSKPLLLIEDNGVYHCVENWQLDYYFLGVEDRNQALLELELELAEDRSKKEELYGKKQASSTSDFDKCVQAYVEYID
jgi:hypothetical protein